MFKKFVKFFILFLFLILAFFSKESVLFCSGLPQIRIDSLNFKIGDEPFRFIGANTVYLVWYDNLNLNPEKAIKAAKENGISVIRLYMDWGHWAKPEDYDNILDLASQYGIYVILTLVDCSRSADYENLEAYFQERPFCNIESNRDLKSFKQRIKEILTRENSVNGKIYKNDTTILAWDIANEIEYWNFDLKRVEYWLSRVAAHVKFIDSEGLVTMGLETNSYLFDEEDFIYDLFDDENLDFFSIHFYAVSKDWNGIINQEYKDKLALRIKNFLTKGKPVILGEFGFSSSGNLNQEVRFNYKTEDLYYEVLKNCMDITFSSGASGAMFWGWGVPEVKNIDMWWPPEIHTIDEKRFTEFIKNYNIP